MMLQEFKDCLIHTDDVFTHYMSKYLPFGNDHLTMGSGTWITKLFIVILVVLIIYETILTIGIKLNWWKDPVLQFFQEKPVHCAHVYVNVNLLENDSIDFKSPDQNKCLLEKPLTYHIEFGPDDYDYEDPELGSTVGFLIDKMNVMAQEFVNRGKYTMVGGGGHLYHKGHYKNAFKKDALCLQDIETGSTVDFFAIVEVPKENQN
ncbi:hypothetical protein DASC09_046460 [Saccharomycopsis crataegensis]|uniref:Uncharacterized protein n=1 Tax=Saccharomycopsis crataegensis TaxID=43959 RepID=A0AAV5QRV9_9ASCO|nr:hypothetical protein DASC09_046460 [Saccharomycopsis crataegensis]